MNILKLKENKNGLVQMTYSLSKGEEEIFQSVARRRHKRFNRYFINKELLKAFKRLESQNNEVQNPLIRKWGSCGEFGPCGDTFKLKLGCSGQRG